MLIKKLLASLVFCFIASTIIGCGSSDPEVYDAPATEEPDLTEEEVEGEMEYTGQGQ